MQPTNRVSILIVDDKPANLLALEAVLQRPEYDLVRANSGHEAVRLVKERDFAAVLLDVQMPGIDGYETARRIKALPKGRDVPLMFLTAVYKEDEDVRRGYSAGGLDFFTKPFIPEILKAKVQIYADLHRMTHESKQQRRLLDAMKDRLAAEKALDALMSTISEGVIIIDAHGRITRTNLEAERIWGGESPRPLRSLADLNGRWAASGKAVRDEEWALPRALTSGEMVHNEPIEIRCFDGSRRMVVESARVLKDGGMTEGAVIVIKAVPAISAVAGLSARPPEPRRQRGLPPHS